MDTTIKTRYNKIRNFVAVAIAVTLTGSAFATPGAAAEEVVVPEPAPVVQRFVDVPPTRTGFEAINWMAETGITTGVNGGSRFEPSRLVTRAEFATFLWRYMGEPEAPTICGFRDVRPSSWAARSTCWMKNAGLTNGVNDAGTLFGPSRPITRAQAVTMLWRLVGEPSSNLPHGFTDVSPSAYYEEAVRWLKENDLTTGTTATTFGPLDNLTRAQAALFLHRYELSNIAIASPGTSSVTGVVGAWVFEKELGVSQRGELWGRIHRGQDRTGVTKSDLGGTFEVAITEPADNPVDRIAITFPSYIINPSENGVITPTLTGDCAGNPTVEWDGQQAILEQFFCADRDENGSIDGTLVVYLKGFKHDVTEPGPRGGFEFLYGLEDNLDRRADGSLVANFSDNSPHLGWRKSNETLMGTEPFPVQTRANTFSNAELPTLIGRGSTSVVINAPASAPVTGIRLGARNDNKEHLDISFDNKEVFDAFEELQRIYGDHTYPYSRNPEEPKYLLVFRASVNGECSSDPVAFPYPFSMFDDAEWGPLVYGVGDQLFVDNLDCTDKNGDGIISGRVNIEYHYALTGVRSTPRDFGSSLCEDTTKISMQWGCVDESDFVIRHDDEAFSIELLTNGVYAPVPFHDALFLSIYSSDEFLMAQYCTSKGPTWCYPDKDYPESMIKDSFNWRTCLLYPHLCWPEGDWPEEYAEKIGRTCDAYPERCQGAESAVPDMVIPWFGIRPIGVASVPDILDTRNVNLSTQAFTVNEQDLLP